MVTIVQEYYRKYSKRSKDHDLLAFTPSGRPIRKLKPGNDFKSRGSDLSHQVQHVRAEVPWRTRKARLREVEPVRRIERPSANV